MPNKSVAFPKNTSYDCELINIFDGSKMNDLFISVEDIYGLVPTSNEACEQVV